MDHDLAHYQMRPTCKKRGLFLMSSSIEMSCTQWTCKCVRLLGPCFKTGRRGHRPTPQRDVNRNRALLAIRVHLSTHLTESQKQGAASRTDNFTQALWSQSNGSCGKLQGKCSRDKASTSCQVIADQRQQGEQRPSLSSLQKLREPLRLPPHSFTYYLTLSSKFFSIFPHGTCLLSVSV